MSTFRIIVTVSLLLIGSASWGKELVFQFTSDESIRVIDKQSIDKDIIKKDTLINNKWFSSPLTRLEMITFIFDQYVKEGRKEQWEILKGELDSRFEPNVVSGVNRVNQNSGVGFDRENGVFSIWTNINELGKPKKPMKDYCKTTLDHMESMYGGQGFLYFNTILHTFNQGGGLNREILDLQNIIRENVIFRVTLHANYGSSNGIIPKDHYYVNCFRSYNEKETHFAKRSFRTE